VATKVTSSDPTEPKIANRSVPMCAGGSAMTTIADPQHSRTLLTRHLRVSLQSGRAVIRSACTARIPSQPRLAPVEVCIPDRFSVAGKCGPTSPPYLTESALVH